LEDPAVIMQPELRHLREVMDARLNAEESRCDAVESRLNVQDKVVNTQSREIVGLRAFGQ